MTNQKYNGNIEQNSEIARESEEICIQLLEDIYLDKTFTSVHDDKTCWHLGDILCSDGTYWDSKDDNRIYDTGNVFAEDKKVWPSGKVSKGWMRNSQYDYVCVLDQIGHNLYILDFKKLQKIYKDRNKYVVSHLSDNDSWGYCVPLWKCRNSGALVFETSYHYDDVWEMYLADNYPEEASEN